MKTPLAWCNLVQEKPRTLVATAGVAFALTLVFLQLGFLGSVVNTATLILDPLDFDIALVPWTYHNLVDSGTFSRSRLYEARSIPGVEQASPLYVGLQMWRCELPEQGGEKGKHRAILVLGFPPGDRPFDLQPGSQQFPIRVDPGDLAGLGRIDTLLLDKRSHPTFTPRAPGEFAEVGSHRLRIAGTFALGTGFASDGTILVSDLTFANLFPGRSLDQVSLGLLKVRPGTDRDQLAAQVRRLFARQGRDDVEVLTRDELRHKEILFWTTEKSLGLIFWFGVGVALLVGVVVVCQVLSSDILEHSKEYATLKAMGYTNRYLGWIVLQQGLLLALFGYLPALLVALGLYDLTRRGANLPILMTPARAAGVLALALLMCGSAALVSVRKVTSSDPANLF